MDFADDAISRLASANSYGYQHGSPDATEAVALAALALLGSGRQSRAVPLLHWLVARQNADGSVGIDTADRAPGWPTGWTVIAWQRAQSSLIADPTFAAAVERALQWLLRVQGQMIERVDVAGHDTTIKGWPWVDGTHAWAEPTAMNLLALKHAGHDAHHRAREAVRLLHDRMLPSGGCNYGNTVVFGQELRAHLQPTGLCLLALAGESNPSGRTRKSIHYLERDLSARTTTASLCYGLMGLAAHDRFPADAVEWLAAAAGRTLVRDPSPYKLALLALASFGTACPLIPSIRPSVAS